MASNKKQKTSIKLEPIEDAMFNLDDVSSEHTETEVPELMSKFQDLIAGLIAAKISKISQGKVDEIEPREAVSIMGKILESIGTQGASVVKDARFRQFDAYNEQVMQTFSLDVLMENYWALKNGSKTPKEVPVHIFTLGSKVRDAWLEQAVSNGQRLRIQLLWEVMASMFKGKKAISLHDVQETCLPVFMYAARGIIAQVAQAVPGDSKNNSRKLSNYADPLVKEMQEAAANVIEEMWNAATKRTD